MTFIYGVTRNARAIDRIHTAAKLLDEGEPGLRHFATKALAEISQTVSPPHMDDRSETLPLELPDAQ